MITLALLGALAALVWLTLLALPWQPWRNGQLLAARRDLDTPLDDVAVLIPARNEAAVLPATLEAVCALPGLQVCVVDDGSTDGTAEVVTIVAQRHPEIDLRVIRAPPLPPGWSGKVWAQHHGLQQLDRPLLLLLDADIVLAHGMLPTLREHLLCRGLDLVSIMASLPMIGIWEKLLIPPFIYFFKLIYPFGLSNREDSPVAAAAGGCILVRRSALAAAGDFAAIRDALIDDCALAARVKRSGGRLWTGQSLDVCCARRYHGLAPIWLMVTRTAFTQLRCSWSLLLLVSVLMAWLFLLPLAALASMQGLAAMTGALALLAMVLSILPCLLLYGQHPLWALTLPLAATVYLLMTWSSALAWLRGHRASWRGRDYAVPRRLE
jgi:hopene-associated glycosyltransferase HpnB